MSRRRDVVTADRLVQAQAALMRQGWPFDRGWLLDVGVRYVLRLRRGYRVVP